MEIDEEDMRWYIENILPKFEGSETIMETSGSEKILELIGSDES